MIYELKGKGFWLDETCDALLAYLKDNGMDKQTVVCAAGMTPSAPIHFGILREIAISSFVVEELIRRHIKACLVYYWDDYDHFCKIPYYTTREVVEEHIGKTLREVPDFDGTYQSYGEHYMHDFERCLHTCGFFPTYNYQADLYTSGYYAEYIRIAIRRRKEIFDMVHHSKDSSSEEYKSEREKYFPLEIYCSECGKDNTRTDSWNETTDTVSYTCKKCGHKGSYVIGKDFKGKLTWKVNWATRWCDDKVCYESSGENQLTDTGSYSVSSKIATEIFGGKVPFSLLYRFIGIPGISKVSRAQGERTLASRFVAVLEPSIIRWLLLKNAPNKPFSVDIEKGIFRIYHEWDEFCDKVESGQGTELDKRMHSMCIHGVRTSKVRIPFRVMTTALAIGGGNRNAAVDMLPRIVQFDGSPRELLAAVQPRIWAAEAWLRYSSAEELPKLRTEFNTEAWDSFTDVIKRMVKSLIVSLDTCIGEEQVKQVLYALPEQEPECQNDVDAARKELFRALYLLLLGNEKGPRLTTLLCLVKKEKLLLLLQGVTNE
ncbi:MAG: lysine--tRNA ligase [Treponema sp.]|nr:lysine--tRNA ligase [Treponema sp.]